MYHTYIIYTYMYLRILQRIGCISMHTSCGQGGDIKHRITLNVGFQEVITKYSVMSYYQVGRVIIKAMWTMIDDLQCLLFTRCHMYMYLNSYIPYYCSLLSCISSISFSSSLSFFGSPLVSSIDGDDIVVVNSS